MRHCRKEKHGCSSSLPVAVQLAPSRSRRSSVSWHTLPCSAARFRAPSFKLHARDSCWPAHSPSLSYQPVRVCWHQAGPRPWSGQLGPAVWGQSSLQGQAFQMVGGGTVLLGHSVRMVLVEPEGPSCMDFCSNREERKGNLSNPDSPS